MKPLEIERGPEELYQIMPGKIKDFLRRINIPLEQTTFDPRLITDPATLFSQNRSAMGFLGDSPDDPFLIFGFYPEDESGATAHLCVFVIGDSAQYAREGQQAVNEVTYQIKNIGYKSCNIEWFNRKGRQTGTRKFKSVS